MDWFGCKAPDPRLVRFLLQLRPMHSYPNILVLVRSIFHTKKSNKYRLLAEDSRSISAGSTLPCHIGSGVPRNFVPGGGVQQIQLRTEDRENGDLGAVAP